MARRGKKAICFRCGAYRCESVRDHLAGRGRYKPCTGQLGREMGRYYDKNGLRIACYVLGDEDEDGLPASEWKERYYPEDGLHCLYIAFHDADSPTLLRRAPRGRLLQPDYFSDLMDGDLFGSDDADDAVRFINDQLEALDEKRERYLEAWEEERRALKRKSYEIRHAKRRRLEEEGSEMPED